MLGKKILSISGSPEIILNPHGIITIRGRSINGNLNGLSNEIEEWLDKYIANPAEITYIDFYLEYLNKANSKVLISMIRKIESLKLTGKSFIINWYYEEGDEDILEKGEYFSSELNIPFNFIEIYEELMAEYLSHEFQISDKNKSIL